MQLLSAVRNVYCFPESVFNFVFISRYMSKKYVKRGKMSVEFMREKEKMLTLVGCERNKKQSKNKGNLKKTCSSKKKKNVHEEKRPHEEGTANSSGPELKKMKIDTDEISKASAVGELASQEEQAVVVEQKIETQILEDVEDVLGVKEYVCHDSTVYFNILLFLTPFLTQKVGVRTVHITFLTGSWCFIPKKYHTFKTSIYLLATHSFIPLQMLLKLVILTFHFCIIPHFHFINYTSVFNITPVPYVGMVVIPPA
jgi:hypothetical protein